METKPLIAGLSIYCETEIEHYRADTFQTKEPETLAWIDSFSSGVFVDVGANVGVYSLYAAFTHPDITVYAIEPVFENYKRLLENIKLNNLFNIVPMNMAVSNRTSLTSLFIPNKETGTSGAQIDKATDEHNRVFVPAKVEIIAQMKLDDLLAFTDIDYIKVDVDGRENMILAGSQRAMINSRSVLIECNKDRLPVASLDSHMKHNFLKQDKRLNTIPGHSSERRGGNPVNIVYTHA